MNIADGYDTTAHVRRPTSGVDPVTRLPVDGTTTIDGNLPGRAVDRTDRTIVRDPNEPARTLVDVDYLHDPRTRPAPGDVLELTDGRVLSVVGQPKAARRKRPGTLYYSTPCLHVGYHDQGA